MMFIADRERCFTTWLTYAVLLSVGCTAKSIQLDSSSPDLDKFDGGQPPAGWTLFIDENGAAETIALDRERFYWCAAASDGSGAWNAFRGCPKDSCSNVTIYEQVMSAISVNHGWPCRWLGSNSHMLYWLNLAKIDACPPMVCGTKPLTILENSTPEIYEIAIDEEFVYWPSAEKSAIMRCPLANCNSGGQAIAANQLGLGYSPVVVDDASAYWIQNFQRPGASIMRVSKDGSGSPVILAKDQNQPTSLAVDATYVYWTNTYSVGVVLRCPLNGCENGPTLIASNQNEPTDIVTDGQNLYWLNRPQGGFYNATLMRCSVDGCGSTPTVLGSGRQIPRPFGSSVNVDENYVYWAVEWSSEIDPSRAPKSKIYRFTK